MSKYDSTHKAIMHHGIDLIDKHGYANVTVEDICKASEIARSTFYNHFKNKKEIIAEHFREEENISTEELAWIFSAPSAYEKAVRVHLNFIRTYDIPERTHLYSINLKSYLTNSAKENLDKSDNMKKVLLPLIQQAQQNGEILNNSDPYQICDTAITLHWGNMYMWGISDGSFNRADAIIQDLKALYQPSEDLLKLDILSEYNSSML